MSRGRVSQLTEQSGGNLAPPPQLPSDRRGAGMRNRGQEIRHWASKNLYAAEDSTVAAKD